MSQALATTDEAQGPLSRVPKPAAYRWVNQSQCMLHLPLDTAPSLQFDIRQSLNRAALGGRLGQLSSELLWMILAYLDIESVEYVRRLNTYFWNVVECFPDYKNLKLHANETLRIISATEMAKSLNISLLYNELRQPSCRLCGGFGPYIFLLFCARACYNCLVSRVEFALAPTSLVQITCNLSDEETEGIPALRSLTGNYGSGYFFNQPLRLDISSLWEGMIVESNKDGVAVPVGNMPRVFRHRIRRYICVPCPEMKAECKCTDAEMVEGGPMFHLIRSTARDLVLRSGDEIPDYRLMASTAFPFYDVDKQRVETGLYCTACRYNWEKLESDNIASFGAPAEHNYHRAYDEEGLRKHLDECTALRDLVCVFGVLGHREVFPFRRAGLDFVVGPDTAAVEN